MKWFQMLKWYQWLLIGVIIGLLLSVFSDLALASHIEKGCKDASAYLQVPHWVQNELCKPVDSIDGTVYATSLTMTNLQTGQLEEFVALYATKEAMDNQDDSGYIGILVFSINPETGSLKKLLQFQSNRSGRVYEAPSGTDI